MHAIQAMVAHALAEDRPLGPAVRPLGPMGVRVANSADAGNLDRALHSARFHRGARAVGVAWPRALLRAKVALEAQPRPGTLVMRVRLLLGLLGPLVALHLLIASPGGLLMWKIFPVFSQMFAEFGAPDLLTLPGALLPLGLAMSSAGLLIGLIGSETSLAGTPRARLLEAEAVACIGALLAEGAPPDVVAPFLRRVPSVAGLDGQALERLAATCIADASRRLDHLDLTVRLLGFGGIALSAVTTTWHLYGAIARLGTLP